MTIVVIGVNEDGVTAFRITGLRHVVDNFRAMRDSGLYEFVVLQRLDGCPVDATVL